MRMSQDASRKETEQLRPVRLGLLLLAAVGVWTWAVMLMSTRAHLVHSYSVLQTLPAGWGVLGISASNMVCAFAGGGLLAWMCVRGSRSDAGVSQRALAWLGCTAVIPALDLARMVGFGVPLTFLEPLLLTLATGAAVEPLVRGLGDRGLVSAHTPSAVWPSAVVLASAAAAVWFYAHTQSYYRDFLLGYNDFGHFAVRVVATWEGRGFLLESPGLPPFWDHCNPGLVLLAPLWGLWPHVELFFVLQALCLAAPALFVYGLARSAGAAAPAAATWSLSYLCFPALNQLNLGFTYGWHPISCALPCLWAGLWLLARGRRWRALACALLACTFEETVIVVVAAFCGAMALAAWWRRREKSDEITLGNWPSRAWTWLGWLSLAFAFAGLFLFEYRFAGFAAFQTHRFSHLGRSPIEILLSPFCKPAAFWGQVFSVRSCYYVLLLTLPLGFRRLARGADVLATITLPLAILIAWNHVAAQCIAFQYSTTLIPFLFAAAITGDLRQAADTDGPSERKCLSRDGLPGAIAVLAACVVAALALGAMPWSGDTLQNALAATYPPQNGRTAFDDRRVGSEGNCYLNDLLARACGARAVLASGRLAAHLIGVPRLETVGQAVARWDLIEAERDGARSGLARFDWILIDTCEHFQQTRAEIEFVLEKALAAGFCREEERHGVFVIRAPTPSFQDSVERGRQPR